MAIGRNGRPRRIQAGIDGQADISGIIGSGGILHGCRLEIEVKVGDDKQRESQIAFMKMIEERGGVYIIARDFDATMKELEQRIRHG
jgi:hypothetical protein